MSDMEDMIKTTLDGIKTFADVENAIGNPINTSCGITIIPISKISVSFAGGGVDYNQKKSSQANSGSASGTRVSVTPLAFLTIGANDSVNVISINEKQNGADKLLSLFDRSPQIIDRIKTFLS